MSGVASRVTGIALAWSVFLAPLSIVTAQEELDSAELSDGESLIRARDWARAESWFYEYTTENPGNAQAWRKLGYVEIHRAGGDGVRARQYLDRALALEPDDALGLILSARLYQIDEDLDAAAAAYDLLIEAGPGERDPIRSTAHHVAHFNRGVIAIERGNPAVARPLLERVLARQPRQAYALFELAMMARGEGDVAATVDLLERAKVGLGLWAPVELWAFPQHRYNNIRDNLDMELGRALIELERFDDARQVLAPLTAIVRLRGKAPPVRKRAPERTLLERHEDDVRFENAPFYLAEALAGAGEVKDAVAIFKEFSRMRVGSGDMRSAAKARAKELR